MASKKVDLVLDVERMIPTMILRRMSTQIERIERKPRHWWSLFTDVVSSRSIVADVQNYRESLDLQDVLDRQATMQDNIKSLKGELKAVAGENTRMRELLAALVEHHNLSVAGDDEF